MCVCVYTVTCKHPYTRHSVYISQFSLPILSVGPTRVLRFGGRYLYPLGQSPVFESSRKLPKSLKHHVTKTVEHTS